MTDDGSAYNGSSILYNSNNVTRINNSYDSYPKAPLGGGGFGVSHGKTGIFVDCKRGNCGNSFNLTNQININLGSTRKDTEAERSSGSDLDHP